jgi:galactokinase/mevalonate kinase-like predicted kinase
VTRKKIREVTSWMGRRSYQVRVERLGIERLREIARENGKLGGRPKGSGKKQKKGGK